MGASGGFPIDLVLFGMIAAFLVLRLRSILGKRTGFERQSPPIAPVRLRPVGPVIDAKAEAPQPASAQTVPEAGSPVGQALAQMRGVDPSFDANRFLAGAEQAFRMIVAAFAAGNRVALRPLLSDEMYGVFEQAIGAREKAGETQVADIRSVQKLGIDAAELKGRTGSVTVRIVSDQVSFTQDKDGKPVAGTDAVTEITDIWTFERDLSQQDPTWRLVAARSG
ncbi:MAG TPA: Tim44/TimA family putative adaptor protein [Rhodopila sp.]|jgi:predicted lipid-binding transport protein (Tim44 family)|nr:Tim44/TimA family putative adaptor protein [Rhodopila sp.]